jgi:hypothetical protein
VAEGVSALARPAALATILAGAALALHPSAQAARLLPAQSLLAAALVMLAALALVARAAQAREGRAGAVAGALGALVAVAGLAADGVLGHHGALTLGEGETATRFEETGRAGARLGLRPLGFPVAGDRVTAGAVALMLPGRSAPVVLSGERALRFEGYRLAQPATLQPGVARILVHREPAKGAVLTGVLLLAVGSALLVPLRRSAAESPVTPLLLAGGAFVLSLAVADHGAVLGWSYGVATPDGRLPLPGVGVLLGLALVAGLLGTLLFAAWRLSGEAVPVTGPARVGLWLGVALASAGLALAIARVALAARPGLSIGPAALAAATGFLAVTLVSTRRTSVSGPRLLAILWPAAVVVALALALAAALFGLEREGTYATPATSAAASAALVGLAALEPTRLEGALRFAFLLALVALART